MVVTIIPTIGRDTLERAIDSITRESYAYSLIPLPVIGGTAGENRNKGLQICEIIKPYWITFLDDDDYYDWDWTWEIDDDYDIVIFRMKQGEAIIPDATDELRFSNVGINFALNMSRIKWEDLPGFDSDGEGEDWRFLEQLLEKYPKVKITKDIYYVAEKRSYNQ
jgi:hypothetical protein